MVIGVIRLSLLVELVTAIALTARFRFGYDEPLARATYLGVFHSISAYNNAGFALYTDSLVEFATDPWIMVPIERRKGHTFDELIVPDRVEERRDQSGRTKPGHHGRKRIDQIRSCSVHRCHAQRYRTTSCRNADTCAAPHAWVRGAPPVLWLDRGRATRWNRISSNRTTKHEVARRVRREVRHPRAVHAAGRHG